ncbi:MAG: hypothetical protein NZZ41_07825 [Candidatus Dojkabacteria bacterium]|nr:hypothetical protein [Candidatus Dojkabacteria bacterium]
MNLDYAINMINSKRFYNSLIETMFDESIKYCDNEVEHAVRSFVLGKNFFVLKKIKSPWIFFIETFKTFNLDSYEEMELFSEEETVYDDIIWFFKTHMKQYYIAIEKIIEEAIEKNNNAINCLRHVYQIGEEQTDQVWANIKNCFKARIKKLLRNENKRLSEKIVIKEDYDKISVYVL